MEYCSKYIDDDGSEGYRLNLKAPDKLIENELCRIFDQKLEIKDNYLYIRDKMELLPIAEMMVWAENGINNFNLTEEESWQVVRMFINEIKLEKKQKKYLKYLNKE